MHPADFSVAVARLTINGINRYVPFLFVISSGARNPCDATPASIFSSTQNIKISIPNRCLGAAAHTGIMARLGRKVQALK